MKKVFVSHPLTGDYEGNRRKVEAICRDLLTKEILPISPLHLFSFIDLETNILRVNILNICFRLIDISDEVWIYGDSDGCKKERQYALAQGKKVIEMR